MKNEKGCLYFYKFIDGKEKFIKIGITRVSSKKRLERIRVYRNKDQIFEIKSKLYKCYKAESDFKRLLKKFRYIPKKEFAGDNECYLPQDNFAEILNKNMQKHFFEVNSIERLVHSKNFRKTCNLPYPQLAINVTRIAGV